MKSKVGLSLEKKTAAYIKYSFNKQHFFIVAAILLVVYLLAMGVVWIGKITSVAELEYFTGTSEYEGKYIEGNISCRTKVLPAMADGYEKEGWYYFMVPYGEGEKYILVYADEKQYETFKNLPEINPLEEEKPENGMMISLTGKIEKLSSPVYADLEEMLGIGDGNGSVSDGKEKTYEEMTEQDLVWEQKMEEMASIEVAIKVMDYRKEQMGKFWVVTFLWLAVGLGIIYRERAWIWEKESVEVQ